jgi:flagella basal body P-ring formation protein FlgA
MSRSAGHPSKAAATRAASFARRALRCVTGASLLVGVVAGAVAQQSDSFIAIPGNAETNPSAVAEMAKSLPAAKPAAVSSVSPVSSAPAVSNASTAAPAPYLAPAPGYRAATKAADAAMRHAALALDARADAADDAMDDASGLIVIPGAGVAKPAPAAAAVKPAAASASAPRDVVPVVVTRDDAAAPPAAGARPIAAGVASPVKRANYTPSVTDASALKRASFTPSPAASAASAAPATMQDGESIRAAALAFLQQQAAGLPGKIEITVTPVFPRGLAACTALDPFMPTGARLWGRVTVGVRCVGERPWTLYVQARVSINATYYVAARAVAPGEVLGNADLVARDGDLTAMPQAVVTDPSQAVGAVTLSRVPAGLPLRTDMLRAASAVAIGQTVRVVTAGSGFSISAEGSAMSNAAPGQQVRVKTAGGQIVTGVVKDAQTVEIRM